MRKLMISTVLAGLTSVMIGCNAGEEPSAYVGGKDAKEETAGSAPAPAETNADLPASIELQEPTPAAEPSSEGELIIGDAAPPISISKWVKGIPVEAFAPDKVYVVEFWATWCGPCLASMPHIASLQSEYGDKVTFIGVSAEEDEVVTEFMGQNTRDGKLWSEVLTYTIALDDNRSTNAAYMEAAGQNGIPCAFIVGKSGKVEWIGHPAQIDQPLQMVVDGSWDVNQARKTFLAERESESVMQEFGPKIQAALQEGDFKTGVALIEELIKKFPENGEFKQVRFQLLLKGEMFDEANKAAKSLIDEAKDQPLQLNQLAWILATGVPGPGPDLDLALSAAKRAEELTESKNASILDTLARVLFEKGVLEEAVATEKRAVELADPREKPQFEEALKEFEAALMTAASDAEAKPADAPEIPAEPETNSADGGEEKSPDPAAETSDK
jgi:thiol-disulfide isomerase/thioredoxin